MNIDLEIIKKPNVKKGLIIVGLSLLLVFELSSVFAKIKSLRSLSVQIVDKKREFLQSKDEVGELETIKAQVESLNSQIEKAKEEVFQIESASLLLDRVSSSVGNLPLEFVSVEPRASLRPSFVKEDASFPISEAGVVINLRSGNNDLIKFLQKIERAKEFIKVNYVNISADPKDIFRHNVEISLSIYTLD